MKSKLTIQQLSQRMAERCAMSPEVCEAFVRVLFKNVEQVVLSGELPKTTVNGLGYFEVVLDASGAKTLMFEPEASLAAAVNSPFAMFAPEMLNKDITDQMLEDVSAGQSQSTSADSTAGVSITLPEMSGETATEETIATETVTEETVAEEKAGPLADAVADDAADPESATQESAGNNPEAAGLNTPVEISEPDNKPSVAEPSLTVEMPGLPVGDPSEAEPAVGKVVNPETKTVSISTPLDDSCLSPAVAVADTASQTTGDIGGKDDSSPAGFSMFSFIVGLIVGLAVGAVASFFYMSLYGQPQSHDNVDIEIVEE